jgi:hypothetical protein
MAEEQSGTVFGLEALKAWAEMSEEEREQARAAFRYVDPDLPEASVALVVLDEDLPANTVASIMVDPANSDHQLVVVSRRTYSYAAHTMAMRAIISDKGKTLLRQLGRLDVTAGATVVGPDGNSLFQVEVPDQALFRETESLAHMISVATSSESIYVPHVGRGQVYRNNDPLRRK